MDLDILGILELYRVCSGSRWLLETLEILKIVRTCPYICAGLPLLLTFFLKGLRSLAVVPAAATLSLVLDTSLISWSGSLRYVRSLLDPVYSRLVSDPFGFQWAGPTFVERLHTSADNLQAVVHRDLELNLLIIGCWHPQRQSTVVSEMKCGKSKYVVEHCLEAVRPLRRYVFILSFMVSTNCVKKEDDLQMCCLSIYIDSFFATTILRPKDLQSLTHPVRRVTYDTIQYSCFSQRAECKVRYEAIQIPV